MRDPVVLLCNPAAGSGARGARVIAAFRRTFGADATVLATAKGTEEAATLHAALRALPASAVLCVAGGDGTLHAVVNALACARGEAQPWLRLAHVPTGSANDGARALAELTGRGHGQDLEAELAAIAARGARGAHGAPAGRGRVVAEGGARRWFANFAAAGSPADWAAWSTTRWITAVKRVNVGAAYQLCNLGVIVRRRLHRLEVTGASPSPRGVFAWFAANARYLGGGLDLGPSVRLDSGTLHIVEIAPATRLRLVRLLSATKAGRGPTPIATDRVTITLPAPARLNLDGELWNLAPGTCRVTLDVRPAQARWM